VNDLIQGFLNTAFRLIFKFDCPTGYKNKNAPKEDPNRKKAFMNVGFETIKIREPGQEGK